MPRRLNLSQSMHTVWRHINYQPDNSASCPTTVSLRKQGSFCVVWPGLSLVRNICIPKLRCSFGQQTGLHRLCEDTSYYILTKSSWRRDTSLCEVLLSSQNTATSLPLMRNNPLHDATSKHKILYIQVQTLCGVLWHLHFCSYFCQYMIALCTNSRSHDWII